MKTAFFLFHVLAILNRRHDRGVGRRPADSLLFQSFDQRRFGETGRRLGKMLFGIDLVERQQFTFSN